MKKMMMLTTTAYMSERFNRDNILILEKMGYEVHVVANFDKGNPSTKEVLDSFKQWVEEHHGHCYSIAITAHPTDQKDFWKAYHQCMDLIEKNHYEFIHCHTPVGGVLGRLLGHKAHIKVMYTAHGFHFFDGAPLKNWLLFYPVEKYLSKWTDVLVTINHEDYQRAKKKFHAKKTVYIPGVGVDMNKFDNMSLTDAQIDEVRRNFGIEKNQICLLSVGELNKNKNHEIVIKAIATLSREEKAKIVYLIAGQGGLREQLQKLIGAYALTENVKLIGYRNDIPQLYRSADIYIHPSYREGLSVAIMEAMASGLPVIAGRIRGNVDLIDENGGILFKPGSVGECSKAIRTMIINTNRDAFGKYNKIKIKNFDRKAVAKPMGEEYQNLSNP